ncbi:MAG: hypothetical protein HZC42_09430 [Candidatus Eisenbacteria bacterium]|nr:hypothetical protein [Candidatus Eisenbacteria bacterium]
MPYAVPMAAGLLACALAAGAPQVCAAPVAGVAGYEYFTGAGGQITRGVLAAGVLGLGGAELLAAGVRYDDNLVGRGVSLTGGLGVPLLPAVTLRTQGSRFVGDGSYRAWRVKAGPQFSLPVGSSLQLWYMRYEDNQDVRSDGAIVEGAVPLAGRLTAKLSASYATAPQDLKVVQGAVGLGWTVVPHLELSGEVGLAQNGSVVYGEPFRGPGLPLLGGGNSSTARTQETVNQMEATTLLGVRVTFP